MNAARTCNQTSNVEFSEMTYFPKSRAAKLLLLTGAMAVSMFGAEVANPVLEGGFAKNVRPFVDQYCIACHSGATPAAQLDLGSYKTLSSVVADFPHWTLLMERLERHEMPPNPMPQPPQESRQRVIDWVKAVRTNVLRKNAGDPGPVLAHRLSNSEYNYTIRDLTGVDLKPTKEFPVDPANQAGFDNTGETLDMSPALFNKYLTAAREVADHMALTPDGFIFAPGPMLVETDRDQFAIKRIIDFYQSQPTNYADYFAAAWQYKYRVALGKPAATLASTAAARKVSPKYLPLIWGILGEGPAGTQKSKGEVGPIAKLQAMWKALPAPVAGKGDNAQAAIVRAKCVEMRDFVVRIREHTAMQFTAPVVSGPPAPPQPAQLPGVPGVAGGSGAPGRGRGGFAGVVGASGPSGGRGFGGGRGRGLPAAAQPLLTWKYTQFNMHRRNSDPAALRLDTDAPQKAPEIPKYAGLHAEASVRWAAVMKTAQLGDPDLVIPAAQRARYEESFARFANVFPDTFYVTERGKFFPDDSSDSGRLLSAGYHSVMGYWRDDNPLQELILDEKGKNDLDKLWTEFDFYADHTARTFIQYYFNQSGEVQGGGAEAGRLRPVGKEVTDSSVIAGIRDQYIAMAKASNNLVASEWMPHHFDTIDSTLRSLEKMRVEAEPAQLQALVKFATRAYRRPLTAAERDGLITYYHKLRDKGALSHEDAMRDSVASILVSPEFFFRVDLHETSSRSGTTVSARPASFSGSGTPLPAYDLASRLSYFLWSSSPDDELLKHAAQGDLTRPDVLAAQTRRMLKDPRSRGLATEFAANWLDSRHFETYNSVDRQRFPNFTNDLRAAMFEEPIRFFEDVVQNDRSVLDMLYGNYTFVNPVLAKHYGMNDVPEFKLAAPRPLPPAGPGRGMIPMGPEVIPVQAFADPSVTADTWVRIDDAGKYERGGLLPMAVFLTQSSPGLRTSPVKRGFWLVRRILGEVIPPPPPVVPELPQDEAKTDALLKDVLAQHRANPLCAGCHARFDVFGIAMEGYGPVGEARTKDIAGRAIDPSATFPGGYPGAGFRGIQAYIKDHRQKDYLENISRKLLSYSLSRSLQLSDEPVVEKMQARMAATGYRFSSLVETIVSSSQFLNTRNPETLHEENNQPKNIQQVNIMKRGE
jgi:Protein of unknown function (DUF1592)/Protein of unknown function (DUF1588)/Protein of unknown function (DUF1587)/Protein of unknown function (DUF1595)/Protein of unknown function (DUF1585)